MRNQSFYKIVQDKDLSGLRMTLELLAFRRCNSNYITPSTIVSSTEWILCSKRKLSSVSLTIDEENDDYFNTFLLMALTTIPIDAELTCSKFVRRYFSDDLYIFHLRKISIKLLLEKYLIYFIILILLIYSDGFFCFCVARKHTECFASKWNRADISTHDIYNSSRIVANVPNYRDRWREVTQSC